MRATLWTTLLIILALTPTFAAPDATGTDSLFGAEDVFELEYATNPAIHPAGQQVVYQRVAADIRTDRFRSSLWTIDLTRGTHRPLIQGDGSYTNPTWSPDGSRLVFVAREGGRSTLRVFFTDTRQIATLADVPRSPSNVTFAPDGATLAFGMFVPAKGEAGAIPPASLPAKPEGASWAPAVTVIDDVQYRADGAGYLKRGATHLFTVPVDGGTPRQITVGPDDHGGPYAWLDGNAIVLSANPVPDAEYAPSESALYRIDLATRELTKLTDRVGPESSPALAQGGEALCFTGYLDRKLGYHNRHLECVDIDGSDMRDVTAELDRSIGGFDVAPDSGRIWFTYDDYGITKLARIDERGRIEVVQEHVGGTTLGRPYASGAFDVGPGGLYAVTITDATRPGDLVVARGSERLFTTRLNEDLLAHKPLPGAKRVVTRGPGNLEVEGWLVRPSTEAKTIDGKAPLVLEIHGGPFANYGPRFSAEVQLYAAAGYAVLYTNPRGSTSYGADFANEIHHNYPSQDYDDLMALVDAAIGQGGIDSDRLFVTGGSGGGVLTAWTVGKTDRFAAAVVAKPVINWASFVLTADAYPFFTQYWFSAQPWEDPMQYWKRSPLSLVGNVTTPTMLLTGEVDFRTPISESEQYYQALKLRKVPTRLVRIPEASHGIAARPSHLLAKIAEIVRWFEQHDPVSETEPR